MSNFAKKLMGFATGHSNKDLKEEKTASSKHLSREVSGHSLAGINEKSTGLSPMEISAPAGAASPSKRNRRANITDESVEPVEKTVAMPRTPKATGTTQNLKGALKNHFLFKGIESHDMDDIIGVMNKELKNGGEDIIREGENGDKFYVIESGNAQIVIGGQVVGSYGPGDAFGELALLYNCPRAATIRALTPCVLWTIDRLIFRRILATIANSEQGTRRDFLQKVKILQGLSAYQLERVAEALQIQSFKDGDYIIRQGEQGETFYIIKEGHVRCTSKSKHGETELLNLGQGDYFGEMALLLNEPRHANCIAKGDVECYVLIRQHFIELLGPLREILDRNMRIRVLKSVPLLAALSDNDLDVVAHALRVVNFEDKRQIIKEGEAGNTFYIINEGRVVVTKDGTEIMQLGPGDFFGERALLKQEPRAANVFAKGRVECLVLDRQTFTQLLGDLNDILAREMKRQESMQEQALNRTKQGVSAKKTAALTNYNLAELKQVKTIGTGTFGRVKLVVHQASGKAMALKCMQKAQIVSSHQQRNVMNEKNIAAACDHPFILRLFQTFADADRIYMLMELVQGGELWSLLYEKIDMMPRSVWGGFRTDIARFYAANVVEAFRYVHGKGVAYRDLKPENLLLASDGYLKMVDFGFAKHIPYYKGNVLCQRSFTLCGTPEYLAPELVLSKGHNKAVDYWALGCLVYELLVGVTPFQDPQQPKIFEKIIHSDKSLKFPSQFDKDAEDLVRRLLNPNPALRLGALTGGVKDIMDHAWFTKAKDFSWDNLVKKTIKAPYTPPIKDVYDTSNFDPYNEEDHVTPYKGSPEYFEGF